MTNEIYLTQFFLMVPIFLVAFLLELESIHRTINQNFATSLLVTVFLNVSTVVVAGFLLLFFDVATFDTKNTLLQFSIGIKGLLDLFWIMVTVWIGGFLIDLAVLKGLYKTLLPSPIPNERKAVIGLLWANFFASPLITFFVWMFQYE